MPGFLDLGCDLVQPDALDEQAVRLLALHGRQRRLRVLGRLGVAGLLRSLSGVEEALKEAREQWEAIREKGLGQEKEGYLKAMETREMALAGLGFLEAIQALLKRGGGSRGSHLVTDPSGSLPHPNLGEEWKFIPENLELRGEILAVAYDLEKDSFAASTAAPNDASDEECWFENTWAEYREGTVFQNDKSEKTRVYKP